MSAYSILESDYQSAQALRGNGKNQNRLLVSASDMFSPQDLMAFTSLFLTQKSSKPFQPRSE